MHQPVHLHPVRPASLLSRIRLVLAVAMLVLAFGSFATFAAPQSIAVLLSGLREANLGTPDTSHALRWLADIQVQLGRDSHLHPMLHFGADLFALVEMVFALALLGPLRNPIRNQWVIQIGILACCGLIPVALVLGSWRGLPMTWRLASCAAALCGIVPLMLCRHYISLYENLIEAVRRRRRHGVDATLPLPGSQIPT